MTDKSLYYCLLKDKERKWKIGVDTLFSYINVLEIREFIPCVDNVRQAKAGAKICYYYNGNGYKKQWYVYLIESHLES